MRIERRVGGRRFIAVGALTRTVRRGTGSMRIGDRLHPGSYRLVVVARTGSHSRRSTLAFSVRGR